MVVHASLFILRQVPAVCVQTVKVPQVQFITVVHASLFIQRQVPAFCAQTVKVPQVQFITVVHASLFIQRQVPAFSAQTVKGAKGAIDSSRWFMLLCSYSDKFQLSAFRQFKVPQV